jgi:hypothetical protein
LKKQTAIGKGMALVRNGMVGLVGEVLVVALMGAAAAVEAASEVLAHYLTSDLTIRILSLLVDPAAVNLYICHCDC